MKSDVKDLSSLYSEAANSRLCVALRRLARMSTIALTENRTVEFYVYVSLSSKGEQRNA
jgi:hypothetical protein